MEHVTEEQTVPGMSEAVEGRRKELRLRPGQFAEMAGLTPQGLDPVRKGYRRSYSDRTINGVADALGWPVDWYDRMLEGEMPETVTADPTTARTVPDWEAELVATVQALTEVVRELATAVTEVRLAQSIGLVDHDETE